MSGLMWGDKWITEDTGRYFTKLNKVSVYSLSMLTGGVKTT
ncbi:hypothetical protein SynA1840_00467 [Synechococcus sp. A18-40]|nr:hypothetical protein SynA1840_00467 [Synechococcus sp. A18-40]